MAVSTDTWRGGEFLNFWTWAGADPVTDEVRLTGGGGFWPPVLTELRRAIPTPPGTEPPPDIGMPGKKRRKVI